MNLAQCYTTETWKYLPQEPVIFHSTAEMVAASERLMRILPVRLHERKTPATIAQSETPITAQEVLGYIKANPDCSLDSMRKSFKASYAQFANIMQRIVRQKKVTVRIVVGQRRAYHYTVVEQQ